MLVSDIHSNIYVQVIFKDFEDINIIVCFLCVTNMIFVYVHFEPSRMIFQRFYISYQYFVKPNNSALKVLFVLYV